MRKLKISAGGGSPAGILSATAGFERQGHFGGTLGVLNSGRSLASDAWLTLVPYDSVRPEAVSFGGPLLRDSLGYYNFGSGHGQNVVDHTRELEGMANAQPYGSRHGPSSVEHAGLRSPLASDSMQDNAQTWKLTVGNDAWAQSNRFNIAPEFQFFPPSLLDFHSQQDTLHTPNTPQYHGDPLQEASAALPPVQHGRSLDQDAQATGAPLENSMHGRSAQASGTAALVEDTPPKRPHASMETQETLSTPQKKARKPPSSNRRASALGKENNAAHAALGNKKPASTIKDAALEDGADDSDIDEDGGASPTKKSRRWTISDRTALYEHLLGPASDDIYKELQVNPAHVFRWAVHQLKFSAVFTEDAVRKHWARTLNTFHLIVTVLKGTGGAGDVDIEAVDEDDLESRLDSARAAGRNIGNLTVRTLSLWHKNNWIKLYSADARMVRTVERNSNTTVSDTEESGGDDVPAKPASQVVSEPKHPGKTKKTIYSSAEGLQEVLAKKIANDEAHAKARMVEGQERLKIERERLELERKHEDNKVRLEFLKVAETSQVLDAATKAQINGWIKSLFE
ncbi:hypothetical protein C8Q79DRAFT_928867 [Trametes meyenii]|nr:hypothetical protein C8Q79DRAFT_928867 [Trametes meyenii]